MKDAPSSAFPPGKSGNKAGRPKGSVNAFPSLLKKMIAKAVKAKGGQKWLNEMGDDLFVPLVKHVVPRPVELAGADQGPIKINIVNYGEEKKK